MSDPRVPMLTEALLKHHVPGKNFWEISEEILDVATKEAVLLLKVLDDLRPPDVGVLSPRQVEQIAAYSRLEQQRDTVEMLRQELERITGEISKKYQHLESGLRWAIETVASTQRSI